MKSKPAWSVRRGTGSFLTLEFGEPAPLRGRPHADDEEAPRPHGERHLWIYCCNWRLADGDNKLASSDHSPEKIEEALAALEGAVLEDIVVDPSSGAAHFAFAGGLRIETWPYDGENFEEQWFVYAGTEVLSFRSDGRFGIVEGDVPPGNERWLALD